MIRPLPDTNIVRNIFHGDFSTEQIAKFEEIVCSPGFECVAAQEVIFELVARLKDVPTKPEVIARVHGNFGILHRLCGTRLTPMRPNRARAIFGASPLEEQWEPLLRELIESVASPKILTDAELLKDVQRAAQTIFVAVVDFNQQKTGDMFSTLGSVREKVCDDAEGSAARVVVLERLAVGSDGIQELALAPLRKLARLDEPAIPNFDRACLWTCAQRTLLERRTVPTKGKNGKKIAKPGTGELNTGTDLSILTALFDPEVILITQEAKTFRGLVKDCPQSDRVLSFEDFVAKFGTSVPAAPASATGAQG